MNKLEDISVLIIEDDRVNLQVLSLLFKRKMLIADVHEWEDSKGFMEKMRSLHRHPDLIIMDIMIDPIDGYEMIKQLRADATFDDVKVIAHTAGVMQDQVARMRELKFDGLISKPITREIFPKLIDRIMEGESIWYIS